MAELILTQEEKDAKSWLDLDDASLGKVVKNTALTLSAYSDDKEKVYAVAAATILIDLAAGANAEEFILTLNGIVNHKTGKELGDWKLTLIRTKD